MRVVRTTSLLIVLLLLAAGCGQKEGVAGQSLSAGGRGVAPGEGGQVSGEGTASGDALPGDASGDSTGAAAGDPAAATSGGSGSPGETTGASGETSGGGGSGAAAPSGGGDRTGITDKEIVIGIHAPVTGAAPFPQNAFNAGKDVYWKWLKDTKGGVFGRNVKVVFRDDQYNPSRAVQVCREMVEKEKAFLLIGGGGADQITACAQYANSTGVPYLSAGVNEVGLSTLKTYFAMTQTYAQQSPTLASLAKKKLAKTKMGIAVSDTRSFADAHESFREAAKAAGLNIVADEKIPKGGSQSETLAVVQKLRNSGAEVVYILTAPTTYIQMANQAQSQVYDPIWIGPGISAGLNAVTLAGCPAVQKGKFLSPFPQLDVIDQMDPNYRPAYRKYNNANADDIGIALWALNKTLHAMFESAGKDMSRESFIATLEGGKRFETGLYPPVQYAKGKHFGGSAAHLLEADCGTREYKTTARFVTGF